MPWPAPDGLVINFIFFLASNRRAWLDFLNGLLQILRWSYFDIPPMEACFEVTAGKALQLVEKS